MPDHFHDARQRMISGQLRDRGIRSTSVLSAMDRIPRELFVSEGLRDQAYSDQALPIDCDQTISQPYIVALMTEALELSPQHVVLEIGTGSGYQTAVLADLVSHVISIERHDSLRQQASRRLHRLGYRNVEFLLGDGHHGKPESAPFDRIIVTAAAAKCPPRLLEQLAENGILVGPFGGSDAQTLQAIRRVGNRSHVRALTPCRFVPLVRSDQCSGE